MKILVLDNYDSFTYNLVHYLRDLGLHSQMDVFRNNKIALDQVQAYDKVLLSPGPGIPEEAGIMPALLQRYAPTKSILGVCLGHQAIGEAFGAKLLNMPIVLHGVAHTTTVTKPNTKLFNGLPTQFETCRYHSWTVLPETIANGLEVTAQDAQGNVMAMAHQQYDVHGVQFHPESILTQHGMQMLKNWLS